MTPEYQREWRVKNLEACREYHRKWRARNKISCDKSRRKWQRANSNRYYAENKESVKVSMKKSRAKNMEKVLRYNNTYRRERARRDPGYRTLCSLRTRIHQVLDGRMKADSTVKLIGTTIEVLIMHLQSQFRDGMDWTNQGYKGWHIDHIIPCASFDLTDPEQQKKCFHYTNLQPLWWWENLAKGDKLVA